MATDYFRGGNSLTPRPRDVKVDPATGLLQTTRGISVFSHPGNLDRFGGAYRVSDIPDELRVIQHGRNPTHFEIVPAHPMTLTEYEEALGKITLTPV
jgi:hypothetical protein